MLSPLTQQSQGGLGVQMRKEASWKCGLRHRSQGDVRREEGMIGERNGDVSKGQKTGEQENKGQEDQAQACPQHGSLAGAQCVALHT